MTTHSLGFPRIGAKRESKQAVESYWKGQLSQADLLATGKRLRAGHWAIQANASLNYLPVGDFSWYDHVLDLSVTLGVIPERFVQHNDTVDLDTMFRMARGRAPSGQDAAACEMTKWFDTNYHYIVPEFSSEQTFKLSSQKYFDEVNEAKQLGHKVKPVLLGPLSYLWLGKCKEQGFDKLSLLNKLLPIYQEILQKFKDQGVEWVQIDEPILVLDLPDTWKSAFGSAYSSLHSTGIQVLLATYFGRLQDNIDLACKLPVNGLHIDLVRVPEQLALVLNALPDDKILSAGIINGRNIWRTDLRKAIEFLQPAKKQLGQRLWISSSCSLLHSPVDLDSEQKLDAELKSWLAFAAQKVREIAVIDQALSGGMAAVESSIAASDRAVSSRQQSHRIHQKAVQERLAQLTDKDAQRQNPYDVRAKAQKQVLNLPLFPTTTIGSFPQTENIRHARHEFKVGIIDLNTYKSRMQAEISHAITKQEGYGLDVLVHGEAERNDMVEYFGELLDGFAFTEYGWVQSYGSRCVKPPVIYGDISRPRPMTVEWSQFAQSKTKHWMKGMLTGPVTILSWSFVRDDQPRATTALQIALALRDEVCDLEKAGIKIIQIDEPAFRECLPLHRNDWDNYLAWAVKAFRVTASGVNDSTQIHTHMCYSEFNDIIKSIAELDADVITIESSRSQMELLEAFDHFEYPNEIGPGVYDIHSPIVPSMQSMLALMEKAVTLIPAERLWVNPDCGLKTRDWPEVDDALRYMVDTAKQLRKKYAK